MLPFAPTLPAPPPPPPAFVDAPSTPDPPLFPGGLPVPNENKLEVEAGAPPPELPLLPFSAIDNVLFELPPYPAVTNPNGVEFIFEDLYEPPAVNVKLVVPLIL